MIINEEKVDTVRKRLNTYGIDKLKIEYESGEKNIQDHATELGCSVAYLSKLLNDFDINYNPKRKKFVDLEEQIKEYGLDRFILDYSNGNLKRKDVLKKFNTTNSCINTLLKKYDIKKIKKPSKSKKKKISDTEVVKDIDKKKEYCTENKAKTVDTKSYKENTVEINRENCMKCMYRDSEFAMCAYWFMTGKDKCGSKDTGKKCKHFIDRYEACNGCEYLNKRGFCKFNQLNDCYPHIDKGACRNKRGK